MAKDRFENKVSIRGWVWDYKLDERKTSSTANTPDMDFISGWTDIATDEEGLNIVRVSWGFLGTRRTYKNGKNNDTYDCLGQLMGGSSWKNDGKDNAPRVRIDGSIETNDWVTREGELVSPKQVTGQFCHMLTTTEQTTPCAKFSADMLAQNAVMRESQSGDEYMELKGFVFGWGDNIFPVTFSVPGEAGQKFFEDCEVTPSEPYFGKVWGEIHSSVQHIEREVDDSQVGFGAVDVTESTRTLRTWDVEGANINLGLSTETVEQSDLERMVAHREERLADVKARAEARNNSTDGKAGFPASASTAAAPKKKAVASFDDDFPF